MKFQNPKTGEVFENTCDDITFCGHYKGCIDCPIGNIKQNYDCTEWINKHPYKSARLMGYEVVEDEPSGECGQLEYGNAVEGMCCDCAHGGPCCSWDENEDCQHRKEGGTCWVPYTKEEANMDKPRIAQVLGVEIGERFAFGPFEHELTADGGMKWYSNCGRGDSSACTLIEIINHPDRIIRKPKPEQEEKKVDKPLKDWTFSEAQKFCKTQRSTYERCSACKIKKFCDKYLGRKGESASPKYWDLSEPPRWTEQEVERAKAIKLIYPNAEKLELIPCVIRVYTDIGAIAYLHADLFPSMKNGQISTLDEIIGGAQ